MVVSTELVEATPGRGIKQPRNTASLNERMTVEPTVESPQCLQKGKEGGGGEGVVPAGNEGGEFVMITLGK